VGGSLNLFPAEAINSLHHATDGIPRLINQVCDHALVLAFAGGQRKLDARAIEEAWADLQQLPSPWTDGRRAAEKDPSLPQPTIIEFGRLDEGEAAYDEPDEDAEPPVIHPLYGSLGAQNEPTETLSTLEHHLQSLQQDYGAPAATGATQVVVSEGAVENPFAELFAEEEVVIDRFASLDELGFRPEQMVTTAMSGELARLLQPHDRGAARREFNVVHPTTTVAEAATATVVEPTVSSDPVQPEEPDMIVVEDNPEDVAPAIHPIVERQEYRQLFAKLRRG
jgi:hypothetical protein